MVDTTLKVVMTLIAIFLIGVLAHAIVTGDIKARTRNTQAEYIIDKYTRVYDECVSRETYSHDVCHDLATENIDR